MRKSNEEKNEKKVSTRSAQSKRVNTNTTDNDKATAEKSQEEKINLYKISEIRQDQYIQIPKELFYGYYADLSSDAKILYGLLLDRMELSRVNNWINEKGEIYLIFAREEIQKILHISDKTCTKAFKQLSEKKLIMEKRQGLNKPNLIFIGHINYKYDNKFSSNIDKNRTRKNYDSGTGNFTSPEPEILRVNKTYSIQTDSNKSLVKSSLSSKKEEKQKEDQIKQDKTEPDKTDAAATLKAYEQTLKENIEFNNLCNTHKHDKAFIDELLSIMLDVVTSENKTITIARERKNKELVKSVFLKLNYYNLDSVIQKYKNITTKITRKRQYIITMLYNSYLEGEATVLNDVAAEEP